MSKVNYIVNYSYPKILINTHTYYKQTWATKLLTTRPSSSDIRGPYVLKIRAMRTCKVKKTLITLICMPLGLSM